MSQAFVTTVYAANCGLVKPQCRVIRWLRAIPAAPPSGSTLATALPVRLRVSARRWVSVGRAAVRVTVWLSSPSAQSTTSATSCSAGTAVTTAQVLAHGTPVIDGSATTSSAMAPAPPRSQRPRAARPDRGIAGWVAGWVAVALT